MIKKNLKMIIITSVITILPMIAGFVVWQRLPEKIPTHWNFSGEIDGWSSKAFAVIFLPLFMLAMHLVCTIATSADPKNKNVNTKVFGLVLWICPVMSMVCMTATYMESFGYDVKVEFIIPLLMGVMFIIIGNYLPKCKQNYTVGIKIPWTLHSEENWNKTHRFAGLLWVIGGIVICVTSFLGNFVIFFAVTMVIAVVPMIYSYLYYRKHERQDR